MSDPQSDAPINRPGQSALAFRVTTREASLARMLARLPAVTIPGGPNAGSRPLAALTTRAETDPTVALLDGWGAVLDVLSFYQERILNEGFLRTATEARSVRELATTLGYKPAPATAASAYLAYTVDTTPGMPKKIALSAGAKVLCIPSGGGTPQTYETTESFEARAEWNALAPRLTMPQSLGSTGTLVYKLRLKTLTSGLSVGSMIRVTDGTYEAVVRVTGVSIQAQDEYTEISFENIKNGVRLAMLGTAPTGNASLVPQTLDAAAIKTHVLAKSWDDADLRALLLTRGIAEDDFRAQVATAVAGSTVTQNAIGFRQRVGFFGADAPPYASLPKIDTTYIRGADLYASNSVTTTVNNVTTTTPNTVSWDNDKYENKRTIWLDSWGKRYFDGTSGCDVFLNRPVSAVLPGTVLLLHRGSTVRTYTISAIADTTVRGYGTSARVTGLTLSTRPTDTDAAGSDTFMTRDTVGYVQGETLPIAATVPLTTYDTSAVTSSLALDSLVFGLALGQKIAVSGEPVNARGVTRTELVEITAIKHVCGFTVLSFSALSEGYARETIAICANVVAASHGETTTNEVLGSGSAGQVNQSFKLRGSPLTYLPAATATGYTSTLTVRVNGVRWREVESLLNEGPTSPVYCVELDEKGGATVVFGDGIYGARLPSGDNNVVASYRVGSGPGGSVTADSLKLAITRPMGLKGVTNPLPASGGSSAAASDALRALLPHSVATLGRAVSLADYEELARSYAGIAKAQATAVLLAGVPAVHLTVATSDGSPLLPSSALYQNLLSMLLAVGNPTQPLLLNDYRPRTFKIKARLVVDPLYDASAVLAEVTAALRTTFSFSARSFGQSVRSAEVLYVMQRVAGVSGVLLDVFIDVPPGVPLPQLKLPTIVAQPARVDRSGLSAGAELILIDLADEDLEIA